MPTTDDWVIIEDRRQLIGGTKHFFYAAYPTEDDAWKTVAQLQRDAEFGVSYHVEHRQNLGGLAYKVEDEEELD